MSDAPGNPGQGTTAGALLGDGGGQQATNAQTTQTTSQAPSGIPWLEGADTNTVGYVQNKGWSNPADVVNSYLNLEKLIGHDRAGNTVVLPKADAPQADFDAFYKRLGRPDTAADYKIDIPQAGGDPEFAKAFAEVAHKSGLSQKQVESLTGFWNGKAQALTQAQTAAKEAAYQQDVLDLTREWGAAHAQNTALAQAAVRTLGFDEATITKLADSMGHKAVMQMFAKLGEKVAEPGFVTSDKREGFGLMTPAQAQEEIKKLTLDASFRKDYIAKKPEAMERIKRLTEMASQ